MRIPLGLAIAVCVALASLAGGIACATIMHGTTQDVSISSSPTGAEVIIDNMPLGKTPVVADLKRKDKHVIVVKMDGYQPFELQTTRGTSGWIVGNILFGGLIGLAVDAITGGMYNVKPEQVSAELSVAQANLEDGMLYVVLVREVDPSWEKIGQLERTSTRR